MALLSNEPIARGISEAALAASIERSGEGSIPVRARYEALARFAALPASEFARPGRSWKHDLAKLDFSALVPFDPQGHAAHNGIAPALPPAGVTVEPFSRARADHRAAFEAAFGRALDAGDDKFASLAVAFQNQGTFVDLAAGVQLDVPIVLSYEARGDAACFPYTLVHVGVGARATVLERLEGGPAGAFYCGLTEIVVEERGRLAYAVVQRTGSQARTIFTRRASLAADATLELAVAELGGEHAVSRIRVAENAAGSSAALTALFFSDGRQHVDLATEIVHVMGNTQSQTHVRSAGTDHGQGRYFGNIKILASAHGADALLRDNALLLSPDAHIDSVPALEIAANDVKAFHGATVGAISEDELFYAQSRGITRADAERMIALGFFEPAVVRFPGEGLRDELRASLAAKLSQRIAPA